MKSYLFFSVTIMLLTAACNNSSENTTANTDTSASTSNSATAQTPTAQDTSKPGDGLMKAMNNMMAKMQSVKMSGDFDIDFANMMIEHHQGALDMAQVELSQGKDEKMKSKAQEIITKQKDEQQKLRDFISSYKPSGMKHGEGVLQKSMTDMHGKMESMQCA